MPERQSAPCHAAEPSPGTLTGDCATTRAWVLATVLGLHVTAMAALLAAASPEKPASAPPMMVSLVEPQAMPAPVTAAPPGMLVKPAPATPPQPRATRPPVPTKANIAPSPAAKPSPDPTLETVPEIARETAPGALSATPAAPALAATAAAPQSAPTTAARFDAAYLNNQTPYPPLARRLGESGTVRLRVLVSAEGVAEKVELVSSSGSPRLDEGAREAVRRWRFIPARQGDQAVASSVLVPIIYRLEDS